ncbi:MAG: DUF58 domain-containing protein [Aquificaceae bacterium]|nr:MAG: DUF58 domain-containing protein [Aquificaceae bacterium]
MLTFLKFKEKEKVSINFGGKVYIGFTLLVGFSAVNTGNNILYILLSFLLALMGVSGFLSRYNLRGLTVKLIPPKEVWAKKPAPFEVEIYNSKRLPSFLITAKEEGINLKTLFVMVERSARQRVKLTFPKRGVYKLKHLEVTSEFPFGLFKRSWVVPLEGEVLVYPQPKEVKLSFLATKKGKSAGFVHFKSQKGGSSVQGIKEYSGEGLRLVHWKAFARLRQLYAKRLEEESLIREVEIDIEKLPAGNFEDKISQATYLVLKFYKMGYAVGLKYRDKYIPPEGGQEHFKKLLRFLALL